MIKLQLYIPMRRFSSTILLDLSYGCKAKYLVIGRSIGLPIIEDSAGYIEAIYQETMCCVRTPPTTYKIRTTVKDLNYIQSSRRS